MSNLIRRMQRGRGSATRVGVPGNDMGKPLIKRGRTPRALRKAKPNKRMLEHWAKRED